MLKKILAGVAITVVGAGAGFVGGAVYKDKTIDVTQKDEYKQVVNDLTQTHTQLKSAQKINETLNTQNTELQGQNIDLQQEVTAKTMIRKTFSFENGSEVFNALYSIFTQNPSAIISFTTSDYIYGQVYCYTFNIAESTFHTGTNSGYKFFSSGYEYYLTLTSCYESSTNKYLRFSCTHLGNVYELEFSSDGLLLISGHGINQTANSDYLYIYKYIAEIRDATIIQKFTFNIYTTASSIASLENDSSS